MKITILIDTSVVIILVVPFVIDLCGSFIIYFPNKNELSHTYSYLFLRDVSEIFFCLIFKVTFVVTDIHFCQI